MHPLTHRKSKGVVVRALVSGAASCEVVDLRSEPWKKHPMTKLAPEGAFEVFIPKQPEVFKYQLRATYPGGELRQFHDAYCFLPTLSEQDLYLFNEGNEHRIYEQLGAPV